MAEEINVGAHRDPAMAGKGGLRDMRLKWGTGEHTEPLVLGENREP